MPDLFVTAHTPPLGVGRAPRTYAVARALAERGPVVPLSVAFGAGEPARERVEHPAIRLHPIVPSRGARRLASYESAVRDQLGEVKVVEALAHGLPVVATPLVAPGAPV